MTWGGQTDIATRLVHGYDPLIIAGLAAQLKQPPQEVQKALESMAPQLQFKVPYQVLPLQDCIDLATFLVRTTVSAQQLSICVRGVGGTIEVAYIQRNKELTFVQQKKLRGEAGS